MIPKDGIGAAAAEQGQVLSGGLSVIILAGGWLAYFVSKRRLFPKRVAAELLPKRNAAEKAAE